MTAVFIHLKRNPQRHTGCRCMSFDAPVAERTFLHVCCISTIIKIQFHAPAVQRKRITQRPGFRPPAVQIVGAQTVPYAGHTAHIIKYTFPDSSCGFISAIIHIQCYRLILWFVYDNLIIRCARFFSGPQQHPELGVIGSVEPLQFTVQVCSFGNLTRFQRKPVFYIAFFCMTVAADNHIAGLSFNQSDADFPRMDALWRKNRPAGHVPLFTVQTVNFFRHFP